MRERLRFRTYKIILGFLCMLFAVAGAFYAGDERFRMTILHESGRSADRQFICASTGYDFTIVNRELLQCGMKYSVAECKIDNGFYTESSLVDIGPNRECRVYYRDKFPRHGLIVIETNNSNEVFDIRWHYGVFEPI